jgi:hypothetical protein
MRVDLPRQSESFGRSSLNPRGQHEGPTGQLAAKRSKDHRRVHRGTLTDRGGQFEGQVKLSDDFDTLPSDIARAFDGQAP